MIRCVVVDDEPWAIALLTDYISKIPFLELVFASANAVESIQVIREQNIDLVFLDIQMPDITGIQFMKIVAGKCRVILTTAFSEHALVGYEFNVIDYLLKPISFDRFYTAAIRANELLGKQMPVNLGQVAPTDIAVNNFIFVKTDSKMIRVLLSEILFIEGLKDYVAINTGKEKIIVLENLKTFEERLGKNRFLRIHKSYIISIDKIGAIERSRVFIGKDIVLPIGDTYREQFQIVISQHYFG